MTQVTKQNPLWIFGESSQITSTQGLPKWSETIYKFAHPSDSTTKWIASSQQKLGFFKKIKVNPSILHAIIRLSIFTSM